MPDRDTAVEAARGADTLIDLLNAANAAGFTGQMIAVEGGNVRCVECDDTTPASDLDVMHSHRLEGASDAADLMLVAWAACPRCGTAGTLVLGYGPNASKEDADVLADLDIEPWQAGPA